MVPSSPAASPFRCQGSIASKRSMSQAPAPAINTRRASYVHTCLNGWFPEVLATRATRRELVRSIRKFAMVKMRPEWQVHIIQDVEGHRCMARVVWKTHCHGCLEFQWLGPAGWH